MSKAHTAAREKIIAHWTSDYTYWAALLAGDDAAEMYPDNPCCGFYRRAIREQKPSGQWHRVGWEPVAIFKDATELVGRIGNEETGQDVTGPDLLKLWEYCGGNAISEGTYRTVARGGVWPDALSAKREVPAANRDVAKDDNAAEILAELLPEVAHATAIDNAISAAIKKVTNETEAAQALGSKNRIAELRLAATKAGKAEYEPPRQEYERLYGVWNPPVKRAEAKEKELNTIILTFRESERKRIAKEQADADAKQREIDEANERTAQRAIAAAEPEPPPIVETVEQPAPLAPIAPTYGSRRMKEEVKNILESVTDFDAVYNFLKNEPKVKALLTELAAAKVKAGFVVPGVVTREGLI